MESLMLLRGLDLTGIFVFAISGGLVAVRNDLDILGVIVVAFLPALGGGTLRDVLLDQPVFWLDDPLTMFVALLGGVSAFFASRFWSRLKVLVWIDAVGLTLFAMVGAHKAAMLGHSFLVVVFMGAITATAGGLIRDIVCGEKAMMLREDIYVTAALLGGSVYWLCTAFDVQASLGLVVGALATFSIRAAAIHFNLNLPKPARR